MKNDHVCLVCNLVLERSPKRIHRNDYDEYHCKICGTYWIHTAADAHDLKHALLEKPSLSSLLAIDIRSRSEVPILNPDYWSEVKPLPSLDRQLQNLITWVGRNSQNPGSVLDFPLEDYPLLGAASTENLFLLVKEARSTELIETIQSKTSLQLGLTIEGRRYYEEMKNVKTGKPTIGFVAPSARH